LNFQTCRLLWDPINLLFVPANYMTLCIGKG